MNKEIMKRFLSFRLRAVAQIVAGLGIFVSFGALVAQTSPVTPRDCLNIQYPVTQLSRNPVALNSEGTKVAYIIRASDLSKNAMTHRLLSMDVPPSNGADTPLAPVELLEADSISFPSWLDDGTTIAALAQFKDHSTIELIDTVMKSRRGIVDSKQKITGFSIATDGRTLAYSVEEYHKGSNGPHARTDEEIRSGYPIIEDRVETYAEYAQRIFIAKLDSQQNVTSSQILTIVDPITDVDRDHFTFVSALSLSPNGRYLFFTAGSPKVPSGWGASPLIEQILAGGGGLQIPLLVDRVSGNATIALNTTWTGGTPVWSRQSDSFALANVSPIGTKWEQQDIREGRLSAADAHVFSVRASDRRVDLVAERVAYHNDAPLRWTADGTIFLQTAAEQITEFQRGADDWRQRAVHELGLIGFYANSPISSDGRIVVGFYQSVDRPPDLFVYRFDSKEVRMLGHLNPQLAKLSFGKVQKISWQTDYGTTIEGYLVYPVGYEAGRRYPLVINTKGEPGSFLCDYGVAQYPSFAPQPLASAGIMVLARSYPDNYNFTEERKHFPSQYPGGLAEAFYYQNQWEAAVRQLDREGLIDTAKIGIIGFSRTGWIVESMLAHSAVHFAAATATDNVQYSLGEYWLYNYNRDAYDAMYGGPPSGETLKNWVDYSISFNLDKIHTPLLMEEFGTGVHDDTVGSIPIDLAAKYEVFRGLQALHRPVDLFYYPNDVHQIDLPIGRLANLERNVDWYRFWLQGYEDPDPAKRTQYDRWEDLRNAERKTVATGR